MTRPAGMTLADYVRELTEPHHHAESRASGVMTCENVSEAGRRVNVTRPLTHLLDSTERQAAVQATRTCSVPDCDRKHEAHGYCRTHYERLRRTGSIGEEPVRQVGVHAQCSVDGCERDHYARGLCRSHYGRARRQGTPGDADLSRPESVTYNAVHWRLIAHRGPARDHACVDCGGPAAEWSYNHSGVAEVAGLATRRGGLVRVTYSTDLDQYVSRCSRCHRHFDATHRREGR